MPKIFAFPAQPDVPGLSLWGPRQATILQPNATKNARDEYGQLGEGVDRGTLRQMDDGSWQIAIGGSWVNFDVNDSKQRADALGQYRWGFGSKFPVIDLHGDLESWYRELKPAHPEWPALAESLEDSPFSADGVIGDLLYDRALKNKVVEAHNAAQGPTTVVPAPPTPVPVVKPPASPTIPTPTPPTAPVQPPVVVKPPVVESPPQPAVEPPPQPVPPPAPPKPAVQSLSAESQQTIKDLPRWVATGKKIKDGITVLFGANRQARLNALIDDLNKLLP